MAIAASAGRGRLACTILPVAPVSYGVEEDVFSSCVRATQGWCGLGGCNGDAGWRDIFKAGGNAVDAVAVGYALAVTHPQAGNLGGGDLRWRTKDGATTATIFVKMAAPLARPGDMFLSTSGG